MYEENNHSQKNDGAPSAEITQCNIYSPTYAHRLFELGKVEKSFEQKPSYMHVCCEQLIRSWLYESGHSLRKSNYLSSCSAMRGMDRLRGWGMVNGDNIHEENTSQKIAWFSNLYFYKAAWATNKETDFQALSSLKF